MSWDKDRSVYAEPSSCVLGSRIEVEGKRDWMRIPSCMIDQSNR